MNELTNADGQYFNPRRRPLLQHGSGGTFTSPRCRPTADRVALVSVQPVRRQLHPDTADHDTSCPYTSQHLHVDHGRNGLAGANRSRSEDNATNQNANEMTITRDSPCRQRRSDAERVRQRPRSSENDIDRFGHDGGRRSTPAPASRTSPSRPAPATTAALADVDSFAVGTDTADDLRRLAGRSSGRRLPDHRPRDRQRRPDSRHGGAGQRHARQQRTPRRSPVLNTLADGGLTRRSTRATPSSTAARPQARSRFSRRSPTPSRARPRRLQRARRRRDGLDVHGLDRHAAAPAAYLSNLYSWGASTRARPPRT